ncbi:hypothetical protein [Leptospira noguchii]|uniref:hypothetical protein n=1 Tax=Leptospira noguchii TaxID=28182 RepID=UPI0002FBAF58|nr:hypothetical protein [Leptospira noguchii]
MLSSILILKSYSTCGVGYDSPWVVRNNSASHSPWVVRNNSASHSPWVVRQVALLVFYKN